MIQPDTENADVLLFDETLLSALAPVDSSSMVLPCGISAAMILDANASGLERRSMKGMVPRRAINCTK